ncbi:MAG: hypothetical protein AAF975_00070 [Spirochaetota bacterium]
MKKEKEEILHEVWSLRDKVERAMFAGVLAQEGWRPNTMVGAEQFERAVARFLGH